MTVEQQHTTYKGGYTVVVIIVAIALLIGGWFALERTNVLPTNVFGFMGGESSESLATVNGSEIMSGDIIATKEQLEQSAVAQGLDLTDAEVSDSVQAQAIDMMINREVLLQQAAADGIVVTDEQVQAQMDDLVAQIGGSDEFAQQLADAGLTEQVFKDDVRAELTISSLLETVFADTTFSVTPEEITATYQQAAANTPDAPELTEDIAVQLESQLVQMQQQEAIAAYVQTLRSVADIVITE